MKNRIVQALLTALLISSMIVSPVFATTLEDMQKNKDQAETEASSLLEQLTQTLDKIDTLEADLDKKQEEVEKAGDDLEEAAAKQTEQYESMKLRIKYMYEEGNSSLLETLFSSTSFTDLLNKAEYVAEVHSYDRDKLSEYEATTKQVETMKNDLQDEYEQMQTMQTELEGEKASLTATLEDKQSEIAQLDQSIQDAIAARQEAERKAQEEAAQAAAAAPNTQTNTTQNNTQQSNNNSNSNSNSGNSNSNNNSGNSGNNSSNNNSSNNSGNSIKYGNYVIPSGGLTPAKGRIWFNGHSETYYSQKVLPGGGLAIPGRHSASDGTIRDKDNYIVVASDDYPKGTVVQTSLGAGKVYDTGSGKGNIDLYTDW